MFADMDMNTGREAMPFVFLFHRGNLWIKGRA